MYGGVKLPMTFNLGRLAFVVGASSILVFIEAPSQPNRSIFYNSKDWVFNPYSASESQKSAMKVAVFLQRYTCKSRNILLEKMASC